MKKVSEYLAKEIEDLKRMKDEGSPGEVGS